jgi:phosphomannomutase
LQPFFQGMTLIKSISGIRGTIGGKPGESLTPVDAVKYSAAYASLLLDKKGDSGSKTVKVAVGRDGRISGPMISELVIQTLIASGIEVLDLGLSTTPSVEMAVTGLEADGGIILTASHNPKQWNALKLLNEKGEFISASEGEKLLELAEKAEFRFADVNKLGHRTVIDGGYMREHIRQILALPYVDKAAIEAANFTVAVDAVNSSGGIAVPLLLEELGVKNIIRVHCEPDGNFAHNPEPLPEHLNDLSHAVTKHNAHVGIAVDPDVDRLALICENGDPFGEEYTLVAVADYMLGIKPGNTVSNLSSTRALRDVTEKAGGKYFASAVGEVNVVELMKAENAVIGGEGNGGVILPDLHYGRDALAGIALFLSLMAKTGKTPSVLRASYPRYVISKNKIELSEEMNVDAVLESVKNKYAQYPVNTIDGVKIEFGTEWVHLRKSNTEPIIRIYAESASEVTADTLAKKIISDIREIIKG